MKKPSTELLEMLNQAVLRELHVSVQYMLQHVTWSASNAAVPAGEVTAKQGRFVSSHSPVFLPGTSLKKIAITEMRHAEAVAERIVQLGERPPVQPPEIKIGDTLEQILKLDKQEEEMAIELYLKIISASAKEGDTETEKLFTRVLADEKKHHGIFSGLLGET